jgi:Domain of unknown function (DUF4145)
MKYTCAHCGVDTSGAVVATWENIRWTICTNCGDGSVRVQSGVVYPTSPFGPEIESLPTPVGDAYEEARSCMSVGAYTAAELICRKILMHVAADKGAKEGESFEGYLDHLLAEGFVTPPMKPWVDLIRKHGNASTHKLQPADKTRAESTMMFTAELLRLVYEMEAMAKKYAPSP